jgi:hypothetical protein
LTSSSVTATLSTPLKSIAVDHLTIYFSTIWGSYTSSLNVFCTNSATSFNAFSPSYDSASNTENDAVLYPIALPRQVSSDGYSLTTNYIGEPVSVGATKNSTNAFSSTLSSVQLLPDGRFSIYTTNGTQANYSVVGSLLIPFSTLSQYSGSWDFTQHFYNKNSGDAIDSITGLNFSRNTFNYVLGSKGNDILNGTGGGDGLMFIGNGGSDVITTGGGGNNWIVFNALSGTSTITDFKSGKTIIGLDHTVFTSLSTGGGTVSGFVSLPTTATASIATSTVIPSTLSTVNPLVFDTTSQSLYYVGAGVSTPFAIASFAGVNALSSSDVLVF